MKNRIQELRNNMGVSQQQCADDIGIPLRTFQRYENGTLIGLERLKKIAEYFHVSIDDLIIGQEEDN